MNWDQLEGKWNQVKGDLKEKWSDLTDDDVTHISAHKDRLIGKIQERYGCAKEEAEQQVSDWLHRLDEKENNPNQARK